MAMAHPRESITQAVVALLIAANTAAGSRVVSTRIEPHKPSGLPAISVYALNDQTDDAISSEMEVGHRLNLEITGWVKHSDSVPVDEAMNNLAEQIEVAMRADPYLGGTASDSIFEGSAMQVVEDDGRSDPVIGVVVLTYSVTYHVALAVT